VQNVLCAAHAVDKEAIVTLSSKSGEPRQQDKVSVAVLENWFPYSFNSPTGDLIGYHLDLLEITQTNTDVVFDIRRFSHWKEAVEAVKRGTVDSIIGTSSLHLDHQLLFSSHEIVARLQTQTSEIKIATSKNNQSLLNIINKGISSISINKKQAIFDKWLSDGSYDSIFTAKELNYLRKHPLISVGNIIWPEILSHDRDKFTGVTGPIMNQLEEVMGIELVPMYLEKAIKQEHLDIIAGVTHDQYHQDKGFSSQNYFSLPINLFSRELDDLTKVTDLVNKRVAITQSLYNHLPSHLLESLIKYKIVKSSVQAFDLMDKKDVDLVLSSHHLLGDLLNERGSQYAVHTMSDVWPISFRFVTQKQSPVLQSILQKSLSHIKKNNVDIYSKKLLPKNVKVISQGAASPYLTDNSIVKGISHDIVQAVFADAKIGISQFEVDDENSVEAIYLNDKSVDVISMVKLSKDSYFYSDELMSHTNVVVSRLDKHFHFNKIADLKGISLIAWTGASHDLGDQYHKMFNIDDRSDNYREIADQKIHIKMLIDNKVDAVVIDRTILDWHINQLDPSKTTALKIDYILPSTQPRYVAFKDRSLRDVFNTHLQALKKSGKYQTIFNRYGHGSIRAQVELTTLICEIFAKALRENDDETINAIGKILVAHDYIDHIKVTTLNNTVRTFGRKQPLSQSQMKEVTFNEGDNRLSVGEINISFSPKVLSEAVFKNNYIPILGKFKHLNEYKYIESTYQQLGFSKKQIVFTPQEIMYLSKSPVIKYTDANWKPLIFDLDQQNVGIVVDYLRLIANKTGLKFIYQPSKSWSMATQSFKQKIVDILPSTDSDHNDGLQSIPYVKFQYAIVKRGNGTFADSLLDLEQKKVVAIKYFSPAKLIKNRYPQINLIEADDISQALTMLSDGRADAFVGHSAVAWHFVVNYFPTLKVVGMTGDTYAHRMLIQHDNPLLVSIIDKAINDISYEESTGIRHRWIERQQAIETDYSLVWKIIFSFSFIFLIGYFFMHKIMLKNKQIEKSNHRLNLTIDDLTVMQKSLTIKSQALQEQKDNFESLFSEAALGSLLIQSGRVIDCNNALIEHLEYDNKCDLLFSTVEDFSPVHQPSGKNSKRGILKYTSRCLKRGTVSFEWVVLTKQGNEIWCNVVLTKMSMNNTEVVHAVISDISDRKQLEQEILTHNIALQSTNKELEKSLDHLNKAQTQLIESEKLASLGELVAGIAHEVNTPVGIGLTGISHFCAIIEDIKASYHNKKMSKLDFEKFLEQSTSVAHLVMRNLERTAELVSSFKQVSVDQSSEEKRHFEINEYVNEILISLSNILKHTNLEIILHCDNPLTIHSYPGAFYQILSNLIINSNIHGYPDKESGIVNITILLVNDRLTIEYKDDGKGIPSKSLSKIFDPFYTTNRENGGSGLGLNIIYNIVTNQLGGTIKCDSELGNGVIFTISYRVNKTTHKV